MNMNNKQVQEMFTDAWDEHFVDNPGCAPALKEACDAVAGAYIEAVNKGAPRWQEDLESEARALFARFIYPIRKARRASLMRDGAYLLDALNGDTILGVNDPLLDQPFPLGTPDGQDKALRFWTWEDWTTARDERKAGAVAAQVAADRFDVEVAERFIALLRGPNVRQTGDLFIADFHRDDETQTDIA